ncbi:MAG TPA: hypothetical protein VFX23_12830 [Limnobacter sp.]|uniref:hypothetical protein n=1 Tax=Limnobacter sp. TaxID=2003368 RepID=UPI002E35F0CB|nr:hypothetical protein [Limnobacter sp.]HEX5486869.1 hypothetical protein [Limnobacter sp.]
MKIRYILALAMWFACCAWVIEPMVFATHLAHASQTTPALELASTAPLSQLGIQINDLGTQIGNPVESMDRFRILCLLYVGVPLLVWLGVHAKS